MSNNTPFEEAITIQRQGKFGVQDTNNQWYKLNKPLEIYQFQQGMSYKVSGLQTPKGAKYISKMEATGEVKAGTAQQPETLKPPLPVTSVDKQPAAPPRFVAPDKTKEVRGKVACHLMGSALASPALAGYATTRKEFVESVVKTVDELVAHFEKEGLI